MNITANNITFMNELKRYIVSKYSYINNPLTTYTIEQIKEDIKNVKSNRVDYKEIDVELYCTYANMIYNEYVI